MPSGSKCRLQSQEAFVPAMFATASPTLRRLAASWAFCPRLASRTAFGATSHGRCSIRSRRLRVSSFLQASPHAATNMIVGIVTVIYNSARVLPEFLASLWAQEHSHFVLYLVDNASGDDTHGIIGAVTDPR